MRLVLAAALLALVGCSPGMTPEESIVAWEQAIWDGDAEEARRYQDVEALREELIASRLGEFPEPPPGADQLRLDIHRSMVEGHENRVRDMAEEATSMEAFKRDVADVQRRKEAGTVNRDEIDPTKVMMDDGRAVVWLNYDQRKSGEGTVWEDRGDHWVMVSGRQPEDVNAIPTGAD